MEPCCQLLVALVGPLERLPQMLVVLVAELCQQVFQPTAASQDHLMDQLLLKGNLVGLRLNLTALLVVHQDGAGHRAQERKLLAPDFPAVRLLKVALAVGLEPLYLVPTLVTLVVTVALLLMKMVVAALVVRRAHLQVRVVTVLLALDAKAVVVAALEAQLLELVALAVLVGSRLVAAVVGVQ